jgi:hypothetical protein
MRALIVLLVALATPAAPSAARDPVLVGTVGPGPTIALTDAGGRRVTHLAAGEYTIRVDDRSAGHNFHLFGPGVDETTDVLAVGVTTWTVQLQDGQYTYVCDPHNGEMSGGFSVGTAPIDTPPPTLLHVTVAKGRVVFPSTRVFAGSYAIAIRDTSRTDRFRLTGPGLDRQTSLRGTGTTVWSITLVPGVYRFGSTALTGTLVVVP